jgi:hypothetical protein
VIEAGAVWPACQVDDLGSKGKPEPRALRVEADDVETDKGHHYFVAGWRRLWSWYGYLVAEGGSNASPFKCQ